MKQFVFFIILLTTSLCLAQHGTGLVFDDEAYEEIPSKPKNVAFFDDLADISSASIKKYAPVVRSQGGYGTCTGWATAYYGRTIVEAKQLGLKDQEEINKIAFSPIFTYLNAATKENSYNCQKGASLDRALRSLINDGSPYFEDYKDAQFCDDAIPENVFEKAKSNVIKEYNRVIVGSETKQEKIENVKRAIHNGNPVIIGFKVEKALHIAKGVYVPDNQLTGGGHAMCVVGFDDEKYGGAFEIINSWGTDWGNNGYIWVKYDDFVTYTRYALEIIPKPKPVNEFKTLAGELRIELKGGHAMEVVKGDATFKKSVLGWQDVVKEEEADEKTVGDYKTTASYPKETRYRMYAKVNQPSYVYVFAADSAGENGVLFPHQEGISPYFDNTEAELVIPGEKYFFRLNKDVDSDYTIVVFSLERIDSHKVKEQLDTLEGDMLDKLYVIFNDSLIPKENIELSKDKMKFDATFKKGTTAMMVLDIKRS